jgi:hypothetical protein
MSVTNTPEVEGKSLKINEDNPLKIDDIKDYLLQSLTSDELDVKIDDMKDYLLQSLTSDELEDFIREAREEMIIKEFLKKWTCNNLKY